MFGMLGKAMKQRDLMYPGMSELDQIIRLATQGIEKEYFQLPIAGREGAVYRERVYCYELYHQMRLEWTEGIPYTLSGEVDKSGHPLIRGNGLDQVKPDFLVHKPGDMNGNHAVIEVKSINAQLNGLKKDLETLCALRRHSGYDRAIYLIYGEGDIDRIAKQLRSLSINNGGKTIDLSLIELWWHRFAGESAQCIPIMPS